MAEPFTPCRLRRDGGPPIAAGEFLVGRRSAWRVDRVSGLTLHCTRWPIDEVPRDAAVSSWVWSPRVRRSSPSVPGTLSR